MRMLALNYNSPQVCSYHTGPFRIQTKKEYVKKGDELFTSFFVIVVVVKVEMK
jgi:hypothetical protein